MMIQAMADGSFVLEDLIPYHDRKVEHTRHKASRIEDEHYYFDYARTDKQRDQAFALRYKVFCLEKDFLPHHLYPDQQQTDEFDFLPSTQHLIGFCSGACGNICGTMRIIRDPQSPHFLGQGRAAQAMMGGILPMETHYSLKEFRARGCNIEQVTSLAFTRGIREQMYFGLCKAVYLDAIDLGIDDIFIQANPLIAWLFEAIGFKKLYAAYHSICIEEGSTIHKDIPVVGMHLDMKKITPEFMKYFTLPDQHFLFQRSA